MYTIATPEVLFQFDPFTTLSALCKVSYTYEMDEPDGQLVVKEFNEETRTFTFEYLENDLKPLKSDN